MKIPARSARALLAAAGCLCLAGPVRGQSPYDLPPQLGGEIFQLGMPPIWKGHAGATFGWNRPGDEASQVQVLGHFGVLRDLTSPLVGLGAAGLEVYGGVRSDDGLDGGGRLLLSAPGLHLTTGADYNLTDRRWSLLLRMELPFRRGGVFGRGSQVRIDYLPGFAQTLSAGVNVPLWGHNMGETRPRSDAVRLARPPSRSIGSAPRMPELETIFDELRGGARWIAELTMPLIDHGGQDPRSVYAEQIARLRRHLTPTDGFPRGRTLPDETRAFHDGLDRAFSLALNPGFMESAAPDDRARQAAGEARRILLEQILLPYNRLLGQRKVNDDLASFIAAGQARFARWYLQDSGMPEDRFTEVARTFQVLAEVAEETRRFQKDRWKDSRLVWIPLQLALRPQDHDEESEIRALIEMAVGQRYSEGNRAQYLLNEEFQLEFLRSVHAAENYHVLWIHDYRGDNAAGLPDLIAFRQTVQGYLDAIVRRVEEYDTTGILPEYYIFLDQYYFDRNNSRRYLRILLDPLRQELDLPSGYEAWEAELARARDRLQSAVAKSRLLQAERAQFGESWLRRRLRVHVNITNPADFSFTSRRLAGVIPVPDNVMRDHRKIVFYDITEADPFRGKAMFTGMGIGEIYAGPNWEDRTVVIQGPEALVVKDAARALLAQQGFRPEEVPHVLRPQRRPPRKLAAEDFTDHGSASSAGPTHGTILQLHNETGFAAKPINVQKAILYTLMPEGSLLKIPDSLWMNYVYASMLAGSALRGCDVLIMAPGARTAPRSEGPVLARTHGLLAALIVLQDGLKSEIRASGGLLKTGIYDPNVGVGDLLGRVRQARLVNEHWLDREVYPTNAAIVRVLDMAEKILLEEAQGDAYLVESDPGEDPKLHLKTNFFSTGRLWQELTRLPEWNPVAREYFRYLRRQAAPPGVQPDGAELPPELEVALTALAAALERSGNADGGDADFLILTVGSANMNYRSMVMDGEVEIALTGHHALAGIFDFVILVGLSEWIDTLEALDALLPAPSLLDRAIGNFLRLAF